MQPSGGLLWPMIRLSTSQVNHKLNAQYILTVKEARDINSSRYTDLQFLPEFDESRLVPKEFFRVQR